MTITDEMVVTKQMLLAADCKLVEWLELNPRAKATIGLAEHRHVKAILEIVITAALAARPASAGVGDMPSPTGLHWLGDSDFGGCAKDACGCVAYFQSQEECEAFMEAVGKLPISPARAGSKPEVSAALSDAAEWCEVERHKIGNVDGYSYDSGQEYGLRLAQIELTKRAKAAGSKPEGDG